MCSSYLNEFKAIKNEKFLIFSVSCHLVCHTYQEFLKIEIATNNHVLGILQHFGLLSTCHDISNQGGERQGNGRGGSRVVKEAKVLAMIVDSQGMMFYIIVG